MKIEQPIWSLAPSGYDPDEEAQARLVFVACENCGHLALRNELLGHFYLDPRDTQRPQGGSGATVPCPSCAQPLETHWRVARAEEIQAAGFSCGEYE